MQSQRIFAVVLAAGESQRFGSRKMLATLHGTSLVQRSIDCAREACGDNVMLVAGHDVADVTMAAGDRCWFVTVNEHFAEGLGRSIACATRTLSHVADALLLVLADQVLVTPDHLRALVHAWSGEAHAIVATAFSGAKGPPVLMPAATFNDLMSLRGDAGARALFDDERFKLTTVCFDPAAIDVDTPGDLDKLR